MPPKTNYLRRKSDIEWVGLGEVRLDLIESHVRALKEHPDKPLSKPLMMFEENLVSCEIIEPGPRNVIIVEGCYTSLVDGIDIRAFIDRDYMQTHRARMHAPVTRMKRSSSESWLSSTRKSRRTRVGADIIIDGPDDDPE